jgi:hypothetical protein
MVSIKQYLRFSLEAPLGHAVQAVLPGASAIVPAAQTVQLVEAAVEEYVPAGQSSQYV